MKLTFVGLAILLLAAPAKGDLNCKGLAERWRSKYVNEFGVGWNKDLFRCEKIEGRLARTLYDLEHVSFISNGTTRPSFYSYVFDAVSLFEWDSNCKWVAYTQGEKVTLCPQFMKASRPEQASTVVHEVRHTDGDDTKHVTCVGGAYRGEVGSCDQKFYDGEWSGSGFNAEAIFHSYALNNRGKHDLAKDVIHGLINGLISDRFNEITPQEIRVWRR